MKIFRRTTVFFLILTLLFSCAVTSASAASKKKKKADPVVRVRVNNVEFLYPEARSMLGMINEFRTGEDAWQLKKNNKTRQKVKNLKPLQYDYNLEKVAMQRALELAIFFNHTRPDGTAWKTAFPKKTSTKGENLAYGQIDVSGAFIALREDDKDYNGQGHRRNMLRKNFTRVGFGGVKIGDTIYYTQEFASGKAGGSDSDLFSSNIVNVSWKTLMNSGARNLGAYPAELTLVPGESVPLPEVTIYSHSGVRLTILDCTWTPADGLVSLDGSVLTAVGVGTTYLTADVVGNQVTLPITIVPEAPAVPEESSDEIEFVYEPEDDDQTTFESYETPLGVRFFIMLTNDECYSNSFMDFLDQ